MSRRRSTPHRARRVRGWLTALGVVLAATVMGVAVVAVGPSAEAADPADPAGTIRAAMAAPTTVTEVTNDQRRLKVAVTPYEGLSPSGAQVTVAGTGFDRSHDLWIAICQDDGVAPAALLHCMGGPIPDGNATTNWGVVTSSHRAPYPGPVTTSWTGRGSFQMTLQLTAAISESADCVSAPCRLYTRSSDDDDRSEDVGVPLVFTAPPGTSSDAGSSQPADSSQAGDSAESSAGSSAEQSTTSEQPTTSLQPTTETVGPIPTTVTPDSMLETSVSVGGEQTVVFTGFTPGEKVSVTLYSDPVKLRTVKADPGGNVRISFKVPKKLPPGQHILQAIGSTSGRVGIARFAVGAAPTTATASDTNASISSTASGAVTQSSAAPVTSSAPTASSVAASPGSSQALSAPASSAGTAGTSVNATSSTVAAAGGGGNRFLWLWIVLAVLVVVGGTAGVVAMVRNRRDTDDEVAVTEIGTPPPTPGWLAGSAGPSTPTGGPVGPTPAPTPPQGTAGGFGLLSGRDHPDGPDLYSGGQWPDRPTTVMGDGGTPAGGPTQVMGPAQPGWTQPGWTQPGGPTPSVNPSAGGQTAADGPSTQQWRPDFTDPTQADEPGGRHHSD